MSLLATPLAARRTVVRSTEPQHAEPAGTARHWQVPSAPCFGLPQALSAATLHETRIAFTAWRKRQPAGQLWCLAASGVEAADSTGVHLLLSLASQAAEDGARLRLLAPSAALREACVALGLAEVLLEPDDIGNSR